METDFVSCRYTYCICFFFSFRPTIFSMLFSSHSMSFDMNNLINYFTNCPEFSFKRFYCLNYNKVLICTHSKQEKRANTHCSGVCLWLCTECAQTPYRHIDTLTHAHNSTQHIFMKCKRNGRAQTTCHLAGLV